MGTEAVTRGLVSRFLIRMVPETDCANTAEDRSATAEAITAVNVCQRTRLCITREDSDLWTQTRAADREGVSQNCQLNVIPSPLRQGVQIREDAAPWWSSVECRSSGGAGEIARSGECMTLTGLGGEGRLVGWNIAVAHANQVKQPVEGKGGDGLPGFLPDQG